MDIKQLGDVIRIRRKSLRINQPTLSALAGVGLNTLVSIERGMGNPRLGTIQSILDTLGLKIDVVLKN